MKSNFAFVSVCLFFASLFLSIIFLDITSSLYERLFNPNYGWWGGPELVTFPLSYSFFIVFLFTLWGRKNYHFPIIIFFFPVWYFLLMSITTDFGIRELELFGVLFLLPSIVGYIIAKLVRFVIAKFRHHNLPMVINK